MKKIESNLHSISAGRSEGQPLAANRFDRKYLEVLEVQRA